MYSKYKLGVDGKTPYERLKGKKFGKEMYQIGSCLHYMPLVSKSSKLNKLQVRWQDGVFLGIKETTGEYLVGTSDGVVKARSLKEKPPSEQYEWKYMETMVGLPWQPSAKDPTVTEVPIYNDL